MKYRWIHKWKYGNCTMTNVKHIKTFIFWFWTFPLVIKYILGCFLNTIEGLSIFVGFVGCFCFNLCSAQLVKTFISKIYISLQKNPKHLIWTIARDKIIRFIPNIFICSDCISICYCSPKIDKINFYCTFKKSIWNVLLKSWEKCIPDVYYFVSNMNNIDHLMVFHWCLCVLLPFKECL